MSRPMVRILIDRFFGALIVLSVMMAAIPVLVLLLFVVIKGLPGLLTPGFFTDPPFPQGVPGGGVFNAIIGTLEIVVIGSLLAVPIGSLIGIFLSEYGRNQIGDAVRFISDVLTGLPSIAFGIFGYTVVVLTTHHFSAISASIALAVLMLPVILRATESALVLVPQSLREAGLAKRRYPVKLLGRGELTKKLTVRVHAYSATAREKIEKAGGSCEVLEARPAADPAAPGREAEEAAGQ